MNIFARIAVLAVYVSAQCLTCDVSGQTSEAVFSPRPYIDFLNARSAELYDTLKKSRIDPAAENGYQLVKGHHTLTIRSRESGAGLERVWIGVRDAVPDKFPGTFIELKSAELTPPMKLDGGLLSGGENAGSATFPFEIAEDGNYFFWGKARGPNSSADSFFVSVDGGAEIVWDVGRGRKAQWRMMKGRGLDYFFPWNFLMSWGACAPESIWRNDLEFRKLAFKLLSASIDGIGRRRVQPAQLWFLEDLEALRLWQFNLDSASDDLQPLMAKMRDYVENCRIMSENGGGWRENTPNIQLQAAAILFLAAEMWEKFDPDIALKWRGAAGKCLGRAWKWKLPDGPFRYSYDSGVDATYFSYDARHLCCIYRVDKNERAASALLDMLSFRENVSSSGIPLSLGSPWWKHTFKYYNRGANAGMLPLLILELRNDPLYARMLVADRERHLRKPYPSQCDWLIPYYNSQSPEIRTDVGQIQNGIFNSVIENGPALRHGTFNAAMPWQPWCESTCGAFYSNANGVESQFCSAVLAAVDPTIDAKASAHYPVAYCIRAYNDPNNIVRATVKGDDYIAAATTFRPAPGGPALPQFVDRKNPAPWKRTDIWFASADGIAGILELKAIEKNRCSRVALWMHVSDNYQIKEKCVDMPGMTLKPAPELSGKIKRLGRTWEAAAGHYPLELLECTLRESATGFRQGETFRTAFILERPGKSRLAVTSLREHNGVYRVEIFRDGKAYAVLLFNSNQVSGKFEEMILPPESLRLTFQ